MPKIWGETVETHRLGVRKAIVDSAAALVARHGPRTVTMLQIAEQAGIGRATLYKYFPDVETILMAWHERHVLAHLQELAALAGRPGRPLERLEAVLSAFALIQRKRHATEVGALLHRDQHVARAQQHVHNLISDLIGRGRTAGDVRDDVAPDELASYCLAALTAAGTLRSESAVQRLVSVTLTGLRHPPVGT